MAFADSAGLQAAQAFLAGAPDLIAKLRDSGMTVEADLVAGMHGAASDLISQAGAQILKLEEPVIVELKAFNASVATLIGLLQSLKDDGIPVSGMLFGGKKNG